MQHEPARPAAATMNSGTAKRRTCWCLFVASCSGRAGVVVVAGNGAAVSSVRVCWSAGGVVQVRGTTYPGSRNLLARFAEQDIQVCGFRGVGSGTGKRWCSGEVARNHVSRFAGRACQVRGLKYPGSRGSSCRFAWWEEAASAGSQNSSKDPDRMHESQ